MSGHETRLRWWVYPLLRLWNFAAPVTGHRTTLWLCALVARYGIKSGVPQ